MKISILVTRSAGFIGCHVTAALRELGEVVAAAGPQSVVHLAARVGVWYSITNPFKYVRLNL